jgi:hypothetical protein
MASKNLIIIENLTGFNKMIENISIINSLFINNCSNGCIEITHKINHLTIRDSKNLKIKLCSCLSGIDILFSNNNVVSYVGDAEYMLDIFKSNYNIINSSNEQTYVRSLFSHSNIFNENKIYVNLFEPNFIAVVGIDKIEKTNI